MSAFLANYSEYVTRSIIIAFIRTLKPVIAFPKVTTIKPFKKLIAMDDEYKDVVEKQAFKFSFFTETETFARNKNVFELVFNEDLTFEISGKMYLEECFRRFSTTFKFAEIQDGFVHFKVYDYNGSFYVPMSPILIPLYEFEMFNRSSSLSQDQSNVRTE